MNEALKEQIKKQYSQSEDGADFINELKVFLHELSGNPNPVDAVLWVDKDNVVANNYNPNSVATKEMQLLYTSVKEDGYTQPIVTIWDDQMQKYVIIDGFHRNMIIRKHPDINERCNGKLPIVVLKKDINQRMASTVRHNRARGTHSVDGMFNIIFSMMKQGVSEKEICDKLGLDDKEFIKIKYVTGFAKIFKNYEYSKSIEKVTKIEELNELSNER